MKGKGVRKVGGVSVSGWLVLFTNLIIYGICNMKRLEYNIYYVFAVYLCTFLLTILADLFLSIMHDVSEKGNVNPLSSGKCLNFKSKGIPIETYSVKFLDSYFKFNYKL